jgi:hypothetical protein
MSVNVTAGTGSGMITATPVGVCGNGPSVSIAVSATPITTTGVVLTRSTPTDTICAGTLVTFTAVPTGGGGSPQYVFRKNGIVVGSSGNSYTTTSLANADVVSVTMTSSLPCVTQAQTKDSLKTYVNALVTPGVNINAIPPTTFCTGTTITFLTNNTGAGNSPVYQWYRNGVIISGATASTYSSAALANGDTLQVRMKSSAVCPTFDTAYSNKVGLSVSDTVVPTVSIIATPAGSYVPGVPVTFSLISTGGGTQPTFQWLRNGQIIGGATGMTYTTAALNKGDVIIVRMYSSLLCATPSLVLSNAISMQATGIGNTAGNDWVVPVSLYPNPNSGRFTIRAGSNPGKKVRVFVSSVIGQSVYQSAFEPPTVKWSQEVSLPDAVANGTYILSMETEDGLHFVTRFTVNR